MGCNNRTLDIIDSQQRSFFLLIHSCIEGSTIDSGRRERLMLLTHTRTLLIHFNPDRIILMAYTWAKGGAARMTPVGKIDPSPPGTSHDVCLRRIDKLKKKQVNRSISPVFLERQRTQKRKKKKKKRKEKGSSGIA